jgi:hypothetical protein
LLGASAFVETGFVEAALVEAALVFDDFGGTAFGADVGNVFGERFATGATLALVFLDA